MNLVPLEDFLNGSTELVRTAVRLRPNGPVRKGEPNQLELVPNPIR